MASFRVPDCPRCGSGILKPNVVFFGDNVPKQRVQKVRNLVSDCDILLVIGSSLDVYSGYRIVLQAKEEGKKFALINIGPTRADKLADVKVASRAGLVLSRLLDMKSKDNNSSNLKSLQKSSSHLPHL